MHSNKSSKIAASKNEKSRLDKKISPKILEKSHRPASYYIAFIQLPKKAFKISLQ